MNLWVQDRTPQSSLPTRISVTCSADAHAYLQRLQRTEDVRFAPDGDRIVVADYQDHKLLFLLVDFEQQEQSAGTRQVTLHSPVEVRSSSFSEPHGLSFLNDATLLVANRAGLVELVDVANLHEQGSASIQVEVVGTIDGGWFSDIETPGSVTSYQFGKNSYDILVCNNYKNLVTQHKVYTAGRPRVVSNQVFAKRGVRIPDGAAFSPDGKWIAISNHGTNNVLVYEYVRWFVSPKEPVARLEGPKFPHGVQFTPDGQLILTVDAGSPQLFSYRKPAGGWQGELQPHCVRQILPTETFLRGHNSPLEGGPKGLDVHRKKGIVVTTCEEDRLGFFDLAEFIDPRSTSDSGSA